MPRRKQKVKYSRKIACKHLNSKGDISNSLQPLGYCPERDLMLGTKAYVCQVCALYVQVKSNRTIDDVFIDSKKAAEKKIKEKAERIELDDMKLEDSLDLSIDEFEEDDDSLPNKFEKRKAGKGEVDDSDDEFQNICPFCDEIFDDLASHIRDCEFAPEDASIEDVLPRGRKKKRRKKPTTSATRAKSGGAGSKEKQKCPYCGKEFLRLGRHLNSCKKKPADAKTEKSD